MKFYWMVKISLCYLKWYSSWFWVRFMFVCFLSKQGNFSPQICNFLIIKQFFFSELQHNDMMSFWYQLNFIIPNILEISYSNSKCISGILQVEILSNCKKKKKKKKNILCDKCSGDLSAKEIEITDWK